MRMRSLSATSISNAHSLPGLINSQVHDFKRRSFFIIGPFSTSRNSQPSIQCAVRFRPCVDIHKGKVKQIVGSTLQDLKEDGTNPVTNFESNKSAAEYANLYREDGLAGGHVIMLGADPLSKAAALETLHAYPDFSSAELNCGGLKI